MAMHEDHRRRVKQKFRAGGLDTMHDHEVLELLLFYAIPRIDVNPVAHRLMERFGSLHRVLEAPVEELLRVDGIGENSALLLHLCSELFRRYEVDRSKCALKQKPLSSTGEIGAYMAPRFLGLRDEVVLLASVDNRGLVLDCQEIARGTVNEANVPVRRIVELAMLFNASSVILAHNHPNGLALPSREDIATTRRIQAGLEAVGVRLLDHIIVADGDFVSLRDSGIVK
ncbi:MAG: RadC family protein [Intestinibacillus sp.]